MSRCVRLSQMRLMAGVMPVIRSHWRLRLSSRMLSLYSSLMVMLGTSVMGARRGSCSFWGSCTGPGPPPNWGAIGTGWAAAGRADRQTLRTTPIPRVRTITRTRISHVAKTCEGLFRRRRVQAFDGLMVMRERRGLLDDIYCAELLDVLDLFGRCVTGDHDNGQRRPQPAHLGHDVEAIHSGHRHVEKHRVERGGLEAVQRLPSGVHHRRRMPLALERRRQDLGHLRLVVHDHDL